MILLKKFNILNKKLKKRPNLSGLFSLFNVENMWIFF